MTTTKVSKSNRHNALLFALTVLWPVFACGFLLFLYSSKEAGLGTSQLLISGIGSLALFSNLYGTTDPLDEEVAASRVFIAGHVVASTALIAVFVPFLLNALSSTWWQIASSAGFIICTAFGACIAARHGARKLSIATLVVVLGAVFQFMAFQLLAWGLPIVAGITLGVCVVAFFVLMILLMWS